MSRRGDEPKSPISEHFEVAEDTRFGYRLSADIGISVPYGNR